MPRAFYTLIITTPIYGVATNVTGCSARHFVSPNSFAHQETYTWLLFLPFYSWGHWGSERFSNMSKDKQLAVEPGSDPKLCSSNFGSLILSPLSFQYRIILFNPYNRMIGYHPNWWENPRLTECHGDITWIWVSAVSSQEALALS